ncbi:MAG: methionine--tRNA ligase [Candidatus Kerfeldbacteria bacterium]|nr:methionine--tRNA ligase [Candidatus Kerfeldbacteria bacterium]
MERFSVTTPIYYVNDVPHVGHLYSTLIADVLARYWRKKLGNDQVWFSTGTDENSQKTVEAAKKSGKEIQAYTDELAAIWQRTFEQLGISFNDFIRTTEPRHKEAVEFFLLKMEQSGDIYKGHYEGWYCVGHEAFMKESDLVDGKCPEHNRTAEWLKEENYFFKLSKYEKDLLHWFEKNPDWIVPQSRYNEVTQFVKQGLEDISITRQSQKWGIPLPNDPSHVIYVWIDALINYLSTVGYPDERYRQWWPSVHVIGKDITKFHCIIWPAMLMSVGIEPPKQVVVNGFFTINGQKISKSLGNAIDPLELAKKYGNDALRYFLFREIPFGSDGDFSEEKLKERYTADLANGLGNLVSRVTNMVERYAEGIYKKQKVHIDDAVMAGVNTNLENYKFDAALALIWSMVTEANKLIDDKTPWTMAKENKQSELKPLLNELASRVLDITSVLEPFMPGTAEKIIAAFSQPVKKAEPLFPR